MIDNICNELFFNYLNILENNYITNFFNLDQIITIQKNAELICILLGYQNSQTC